MSLVNELCSAGTNRLVVPPVILATVGSRAFPVAAAHTWNSLPEHIVSASTLQSFKRHLKTFLLTDHIWMLHSLLCMICIMLTLLVIFSAHDRGRDRELSKLPVACHQLEAMSQLQVANTEE